ncbi:MAG: putative transporter [Duodenibacillus sp.]|nr:putative transporter [Duodenibacillus sp.]
MSWLAELLSDTSSFAHGLLVYSLLIAAGLAAGRVKVLGVSLGSAAVLFLGLAASYFGARVDPAMLGVFRNFGLILFVFFIGMQVGPSFFATFKAGGWGLNALMALSILMSLAVTAGLYFALGGAVALPEIIGVHFGAITSTPGLGAAQEALAALGDATDITTGYACAYPAGILCNMAAIALLQAALRVRMAEEDALWDASERASRAAPEFYHAVVENRALDNLTVGAVRDLVNRPFICSRILHGGVISSPTASTPVHLGDTLRIVSTPEHKPAVVAFCGREDKEVDLATEHSPLVTARIRVTREKMNGATVESLHLSRLDGVNITRVARSGVEFLPYAGLRLQLGDTLTCVGPRNAVARLEAVMGNVARRLDKPNVVAIFLGIAFGLVLASVPLAVPGMPAPIRLGLAGGPLIAAILLSHFGPRFRLVTYTTHSANLMLREWGLAFFLASVGLAGGEQFFAAFAEGKGLLYVGLAAAIAMLPALACGLIARKLLRLNFHSVAGLLAGSTTNTTTLGFACSLSDKGAAVISYATVYPLAMFLRILSGQVALMILWPFAGG